MKKIANFFKKILLNGEGKISFTKLGGTIAASAYTVLQMPSIGIDVPVDLVNTAKIIIAVGMTIGIAGARDAFDKIKR